MLLQGLNKLGHVCMHCSSFDCVLSADLFCDGVRVVTTFEEAQNLSSHDIEAEDLALVHIEQHFSVHCLGSA